MPVIRKYGVCKHCERGILLLIDEWVHTGTGQVACENGKGMAEPK